MIAQHPLERRADARLMVVDRAAQEISHRHVRDLPEILASGDCLVLNDTKVVPARLVGERMLTGGRWEGLFLKVDAEGHWLVLAKTRGKPRFGETIALHDRAARPGVLLRLIERLDEGEWRVHPESDEPTFALLERYGRVPLPAYIRDGEMLPADRETYQTVFAAQPGAVAAPTAGLHFTNQLLDRIAAAGVETCRLTLHVGWGTFKPIKSKNLADHRMHAEWGRLEPAAIESIERARQTGNRVVAVGTTAIRVLETAGARGQLGPWTGETELFIRPPYTFRVATCLMTNFHLPRTTLLVLVRTFGGDRLIQRAYAEAISERYRFYSYGDAMLIV